MALSLFVFLAVPGVLLLLGHPWGAAVRRTLEQRFGQSNPRAIALMMMWLGIWVPGLLVAGTFPPTPVSIVFALVVLPFGPWLLVIMLAREGKISR
ncbi:MAG TPA: hypothetical protein VGS80_23250 [Ktedonobacterales bacterium]|nr:hypothetical protein [Ktedonobacterales bacterium]